MQNVPQISPTDLQTKTISTTADSMVVQRSVQIRHHP